MATSPGTASTHGTFVRAFRRARGAPWAGFIEAIASLQRAAEHPFTSRIRLRGASFPGSVHRIQDVVDRALAGDQPDLILLHLDQNVRVPELLDRTDDPPALAEHRLLARHERGELTPLELVLRDPALNLGEQLVLRRPGDEVDEGVRGFAG